MNPLVHEKFMLYKLGTIVQDASSRILGIAILAGDWRPAAISPAY